MEIVTFIDTLTDEMEPLRDIAVRLSSGLNEINGDMIALSHRPHVAPQSYALRLNMPLPQANLIQYQLIHKITLSPHYLPILQKLNGAEIFELSLFGIPPSMANNPPLLDRTAAMPLDIATANAHWKFEYAIQNDWFHFGGGPLSLDENIGYFFDSVGKIYSIRKNGEIINSWVLFSQFLYDEIFRCEALYPAYEEFMAEAICEFGTKTPWWRKFFNQ
jgi:hypothetical protein